MVEDRRNTRQRAHRVSMTIDDCEERVRLSKIEASKVIPAMRAQVADDMEPPRRREGTRYLSSEYIMKQ